MSEREALAFLRRPVSLPLRKAVVLWFICFCSAFEGVVYIVRWLS